MDNKPTDKGEWQPVKYEGYKFSPDNYEGVKRIRRIMAYAQDFKRFRKLWLAKAYKSMKKILTPK